LYYQILRYDNITYLMMMGTNHIAVQPLDSKEVRDVRGNKKFEINQEYKLSKWDEHQSKYTFGEAVKRDLMTVMEESEGFEAYPDRSQLNMDIALSADQEYYLDMVQAAEDKEKLLHPNSDNEAVKR
jgi:hypothetical protein